MNIYNTTTILIHTEVKNEMKHKIIILILFSAILLTSCHNESAKQNNENTSNIEQTDPFHKALNTLYHSSYEYKKTTKSNNKVSLVMEGKILDQPFQEYQKIIQSTGISLFSECYTFEKNHQIKAVIKTEDGFLESEAVRNYPFGYGYQLNGTLQKTEQRDGKIIDIYTTQYEENIGKLYRLKGELIATISQEYIIDKESNSVLQMTTDLTDRNKCIAIANSMSSGTLSLDEAKKKLTEEQYNQTIEMIEFSNYNGDISIQLPKINK